VGDGPGVHLGLAQAGSELVDADAKGAVELAEDVGAPVLQVEPVAVDLLVPVWPVAVEQGGPGGGAGEDRG
jgi:hypothetical protein